MMLGGGRARAADTIDPRVGLAVHARIGDRVTKEQPLFVLHHADRGVADAARLLQEAVTFSDDDIAAPALFSLRIDGGAAR